MLLEAYILLHLSRLMLWVLPFRWCLKLCAVSGKPGREPDEGELAAITRAIRRAGRKTVFDASCLVKAIVARWMLRRRNIHSVLYFGVQSDSLKKIAAHAWVVSHQQEITPRSGDYKVLLEH